MALMQGQLSPGSVVMKRKPADSWPRENQGIAQLHSEFTRRPLTSTILRTRQTEFNVELYHAKVCKHLASGVLRQPPAEPCSSIDKQRLRLAYPLLYGDLSNAKTGVWETVARCPPTIRPSADPISVHC